MTTRRRTTAARKASAQPALRLEGALTIRNAADALPRLRATLAAGSLRLDAAAVAQVDTAGLQVLVAAVAAARSVGMQHEWVAVSPALADAARRLGLVALLDLPPATAA